jgi:SAM-dependent methyltransferase
MNPLKHHWEAIYQTKSPSEVSWYQTYPALSLQLIQKTKITSESFIDVGGGTSVLADYLLELGLTNLTVLDLSAAALQQIKNRLGNKAQHIQWIEADVTQFQPSQSYFCWHDRAVFHFLTDAEARRRYVDNVKSAVLPKGYVIIATFAINGPKKCSGLDIVQYDAEKICSEFGNSFTLLEVHHEAHLTPAGAEQNFSYFLFKKSSD